MLISIQGVTFYAHCYIRREAICSLLYMECSLMLIAIHEVKRYAHCYIWSQAPGSMLYKE